MTHHRGADEFVAILAGPDFEITYMPCHEAAVHFPSRAEDLDAYDCIILSDIGSNTLLLSPEVWIHSRRAPNRLKLLRSYVERGGGLVMVGGYYSFQASMGERAITIPPRGSAADVGSIPTTIASNSRKGF